MSKHIISASEMERYGYCPLSWHLDLKGIDAEGEEVTSGVEKHKEIGTSLTNLLVEEKKSRETSSTLLTVVGMIMAVVTIALFILWISTDSLREFRSYTFDNRNRVDACSFFFPLQAFSFHREN